MEKKPSENTLIYEVGQRIQKYRTQRNLTQEQIAEMIGISQKHLSRIERGYHNPRFDMVIQIAQILHIPTDALARDLSDNDVDVFLESIRPHIEKLSPEQLKYLKQSIELLSDFKF